VTRTPRIRSTAAVAGAVIGAVVLAGCSAGQITQTSSQVTAVDGANANAGTIAVRNAHFALPEDVKTAVAYPRGSSAPLQLVIINTGGATDELVSVTSPIAGTGEVTGKRDVPGGRTLLVEGEPQAAAAATPTAAAGATPSAAAGATPSATAGPPSATPAPTTAAATPSAEPLSPDAAGTAQIVLTGLRDDIRSGITYEVVLNFRNAGPLRLAVPVAGSEAERKDQTEAEH
jgi:copper(I)-binding protein